MTENLLSKSFKGLALSLSITVFIGCTLAAKSSVKNENAGGGEAIPSATPVKTAVKTEPKIFGLNLIKNGGAEGGNTAGWTNPGDNLKTFRYDGGWGDALQVTPPNHGDSFFYATVSKDMPDAVFTQDINVAEIAGRIDAGKVSYNLSGWFGVKEDTAARLLVTFYGANDAEIKRAEGITDATEEITEENSPNDVTMVGKSGAGDVPAGTRKIKVTLKFSLFRNRSTNESDTATADNFSLVLNDKGDR